MREAAMTPEVPLVETEAKANHVNMGKNRAQRASNPHAFRNLWLIEAGSDTQGGDRV